MALPIVLLAEGREKSLLRRHPWVFSGAIADGRGEPAPGDTVEVRDSRNRPLGLGAWSPASQIRVRMWTFDNSTPVDADFFKSAVARCAAARRSRGFIFDDTSAFRLVHAENDGLPGCIVDRYGRYLVIQFLSAAWEKWGSTLVEALRAADPECRGILERSDADVRAKEGLSERVGVLYGSVPQEPVVIVENGMRLRVDLWKGHKTGYYLDQRDARRRIGEIAQGRRVLNCFCYTGGFGLFAARGGAISVEQVDVSADALNLARAHAEINHLAIENIVHTEADVFAYLRKLRDRAQTFDLIVLDPPKFVDSQSSLEKAARGYKDINLLAFKLLAPGGMLATFSCSGLMGADLFQKIVADAASDARRPAQILEKFGQPADHAVATAFPEGFYLKGLLCQVD